MEMLVSTSSITMSSLSVSARSWECSVTTCNALIIKFSVSSVLPEDSLSMALRRGKQKEKAGADNGAMSKKINNRKKECVKSVCQHESPLILFACSDLLGLHLNETLFQYVLFSIFSTVTLRTSSALYCLLVH